MPTTIVTTFGLLALAIFLLKRRQSNSLLRPPGPQGLPVLGNMFQMPMLHPWKTFAEWGKTFGDPVCISVLQQPTIILNSARTISQLLDKPAYAGRPVFTMYGILVGWGQVLTLLQSGETFRAHRKLLHSVLGTNASVEKTFGTLQEEETRRFLKRVLQEPLRLVDHIRLTAGTIVLQVSHGYRVQEQDDPFVEFNNRVSVDFSEATSPGAYLVDLFPILQYLPDWFPGAGFKQKVKEYKKHVKDLVEIPHQYVKLQMEAGIAPASFTSTHLSAEELTPEEEHNIKYAAAQLYGAGVDTITSSIHTFFLTMTLYPDVQRKAQEELDAVLGPGILPTLKDRTRLPYVDALVKEVLRWHPAAPLGMPHRVCEEDVYEGYTIPKDATVFTNIWQLLHDPEVYADPTTFNPGRFVRHPERDPRDFCFGFGRRICPGLILGDSSVFISCAMALSVFNITRVGGKDPVVDFTSGIISHPKPFECSIRPRSDIAKAVIHSIG